MKVELLSRLWLHEPDADTTAQATRQLGLPSATPAELASAYTDVFLLNVPPYGTAFTDPDGELNGLQALRLAALYEAHGYCPPELNEVGAADHLGLCLGFLAHAKPDDILPYILEWAPVCCLAVEREPAAHPFYHVLATKTRQALLAQCVIHESQYSPSLIANDQLPITDSDSNDELRLRDLIRFFLAPARCGVFLSRSRLGQMARALGLRLPFGSRFDVAEMLFASAGEAEQLEALLTALETEIEMWAREYRRWAETVPAWRPTADDWLARTAEAARTLAGMRALAAAAPA